MPTRKSAAKNGKWTVKELESIKADWKGESISDGDGLFGEVRVNPNGEVKISFRYGLKLNGKKVWHYCGMFPDTDLTKIREERNNARTLVKAGIDPRVKKVTDKILKAEEQAEINAREAQRKADSLTVKDMIDDWLELGVKRKDDNKSIIQSLQKYILPEIGDIEVRKLTENHLIKIYKPIIAKDKGPTALELSKTVKQMLSWAEKRNPWRRLLIDGNPAELVEIDKLLPASFTKVRDRVLSSDEIRKLKSIFDEMTSSYVSAQSKYEIERPLLKEIQLAMWLCLSTLCRIGELLQTEWKHVDFEKKVWFIPAENTKGQERKKTPHTIYLSDFSLAQFKELQKLTGDSKWVFPGRYKESHVDLKSYSKQIGDRQVKFSKRTRELQFRVESNSLVLGDREWTPHDLRRTGATMMQGLLGISNGLLVTDLCLHHTVVTGSAKHYMFEEYEDVMRDAWAKLGSRIQAILSSNNLVNFVRASGK